MAFALSINAQITIDSSDFAGIGDTVVLINNSVPPIGISVGGTGAQSLDFSSLQIDYFDTLAFRSIDTASADSSFPASNLAMENTSQTVYFNSSLSELSIIGLFGDPMGSGVDLPFNFNPPQTMMEYPSTYNDSFNDTSKAVVYVDPASVGASLPGVDSIKIVHLSYGSSRIDAYGTVEIPNATYNTIRQYYTENTIDSI